MTPEQQAEASYMAWLNDNSNFAAPAPSLSVASQAGAHPNNFVDVRYADTPRVDYPVPTGPQPRTQYYGGNTYGPLGPLGVDPRTIGHVSAHNDPYHSTMSAVTVNGSVGPVVSYASRDPHVLWAPEVPDAYVLLNQALAAGRRDPDPRMFDLLAGLMRQQPAPRQGGGGAPAPGAAVTKTKQTTTAVKPELKEGSASMERITGNSVPSHTPTTPPQPTSGSGPDFPGWTAILSRLFAPARSAFGKAFGPMGLMYDAAQGISHAGQHFLETGQPYLQLPSPPPRLQLPAPAPAPIQVAPNSAPLVTVPSRMQAIPSH